MEIRKFLPEVICVLSEKDASEPEKNFREMTRYACVCKLYGVQVPHEFVGICRDEINEWRKREPFHPHQPRVIGVDSNDIFVPFSKNKFIVEWRTLQVIVNNMEKCTNESVGGILERNNKVYLIDRRFEPHGWACPAGHLDEGETPEEMVAIEFEEEIGLKAIPAELLLEEMIPWDNCWRSKGEGHYWHVFRMNDPDGEPVPDPKEAKSGGWFSREELQNLNLQEAWRYFFKKLGYII